MEFQRNPVLEKIIVALNPAPPRKRYVYAPDYDVLETWFNEHVENPYPTRTQKEELAQLSNLKVEKVSSWFDKKRMRLKRSRLAISASRDAGTSISTSNTV